MSVAPAPLRVVSHGEVFTRRWVVETILDLVGYTTEKDLAGLVAVEPACGTGAFLEVMVERLLATRGTVDHAELAPAIRAYDLNAEHVAAARALIQELLLADGCSTQVAEALIDTWIRCTDFLLAEDIPAADVVVGNPPYVRAEEMDPELSPIYRKRWPTMGGKGDLFVGFVERGLTLLRPEGRLGFICADRWMRNAYGAKLRAFVTADFAVEHIWTMHTVDAFEADVDAYPAITVMRRGEQADAVTAEAVTGFDATAAQALAHWHGETFHSPVVTAQRTSTWFTGPEMWPTGNPARLAMIAELTERFSSLQDDASGTRVGIGVATGADKVYVVPEPVEIEPDRLLPLTTGRDLREGTYAWSGTYLVNPWHEDGSLVDLNEYPLMRAYLEDHGAALKRRHTAQKTPDRWHRTIDKVNAALIDQPKLLIGDMRMTLNPVLEPGGHYPHHNLYWITSDTWDLEVLGGILLSDIAQAFVEAYSVRMRGGTLRFQAQYLKKIRVPRPADVTEDLAEELRQAFRTRDTAAATVAAHHAYGLNEALVAVS